jgi:ribosomal protein S18 acetylase RimI-like enzyme
MSSQLRGYIIDKLKPHQIDSLLDLQRRNLREYLDAQTIESQGYVSFHYTPDILQKKMSGAPQIIAREGDTVVAYALSTIPEISKTIDAFVPLLEKFKTIAYHGKMLTDWRYYIVGQVCVDEKWRGKGVFDALYAEHKRLFQPDYDFVVTVIDSDNTRSLAAHWRIGFKTIHTYFDDYHGKEWQLVLWDFGG